MYCFRHHCNNWMHVLHQQENFHSNQYRHFPHDTCTYLIRRHYITDVTSDQDRRFCKYAQCHFVYQILRKLQSCRAVSIPSMTSSPLVTAASLAHAGSFLAHDQTLTRPNTPALCSSNWPLYLWARVRHKQKHCFGISTVLLLRTSNWTPRFNWLHLGSSGCLRVGTHL